MVVDPGKPTVVSTLAPPSFFVAPMSKEVKPQKQKGARAKNGCWEQKT